MEANDDDDDERRQRCLEGSYVCDNWELRVTARCLDEDLQRAGAPFVDILNVPIVKAFIAKRCDRTEDTREVNDVRCKVPIWVLARGDDHRGGTLYDEVNQVVWLVASRLHRSGADDDFFPYCVAIDQEGRLLPTGDDYKKLFDERSKRFAYLMRIEAPLLLKQATSEPGTEASAILGGRFGVGVTIEVDDDVEATTVAIRVEHHPWEHLMLVLAAIRADAIWEPIDGMPNRELDEGEMAWTHMRETG